MEWAGTYLRAIQGDGEIGCIKHFPGLGAATTDAHEDLPVVKRSQNELYSTELAPFKYFVQSQNSLEDPGMIMTTAVLMPAIAPNIPPALPSPFLTTPLLHNSVSHPA